MVTRRSFCFSAASCALLPQLGSAQAAATRLNVGQIDHDRILSAAAKALTHPPAANRDPASQAFLDFTLDVSALAAANIVAPDPRYPAHALEQLTAWLVVPETAVPAFAADPDAVLQTACLAEVAVAMPFLDFADSIVKGPQLEQIRAWVATYLRWLTESKIGLLARDAKNHHAASWLLQTAAYARLGENDAVLTELRHRFKTSTIRAQINSNGYFSNELTTADPFRNSLLSLDLLAGACVLLSTRFDSLWEHELQDGPGMRAAIARHAAFIASPHTWPYPADSSHFHDLPGRRPALLFAARAYQQADYAALWRKLPADPVGLEEVRAFPITQPILWQPISHPQAI